MSTPWDPTALPKLTGRTIVVTGGNGGLGYFVCEQLAGAGATVIMASRNTDKAHAAIAAIRTIVPGADVRFQELDLANLESVGNATVELSREARIDSVVANAGVVGSPRRRSTTDGFELQFGTNHLGHYALLAGLMPVLETSAARIVHLGSISHRWVRLDTNNLMPRKYHNYRSYAVSKLAGMTFGFELAERLRLLGSPVSSVVAHPGFALGMFTQSRPGIRLHETVSPVRRAAMRGIAHGKDTGAWPLVRAAVDSAVPNGAYCGPDGWFQLKGQPAIVTAEDHARERNTASRLIDASEELTGMRLVL